MYKHHLGKSFFFSLTVYSSSDSNCCPVQCRISGGGEEARWPIFRCVPAVPVSRIKFATVLKNTHTYHPFGSEAIHTGHVFILFLITLCQYLRNICVFPDDYVTVSFRLISSPNLLHLHICKCALQLYVVCLLVCMYVCALCDKLSSCFPSPWGLHFIKMCNQVHGDFIPQG